jgi:hypothetical protein
MFYFAERESPRFETGASSSIQELATLLVTEFSNSKAPSVFYV